MTGQREFASALRRIREARGLTQATLASRVPCSQSVISKLEMGRKRPTLELIAKCERALGVSGELTAVLNRGAIGSRGRGLPPEDGYFTGRQHEIAVVSGALESGRRICAISGIGGVGKTALALRCARSLAADYPDGVFFLRLSPSPAEAETAAESPNSLNAILAGALRQFGILEERISHRLEDRAIQYRAWLHNRKALLILDDAQSAAQVRMLLPSDPGCPILVTSRRRLAALDDAELVALGVLEQDDAAELFSSVARIKAGSGSEADALARVVDLCGRHPLALRIAAARLRHDSPHWTLAVLEDRLSAENRRLAELDDGERSLTASFEMSLHDLGPDHMELFLLLGAQPGRDFGAFTAASLLGTNLHRADRLLSDLVEANLVEPGGTGRYRSHDLLREFASRTCAVRKPADECDAALVRLTASMRNAALHADELLDPLRFRLAFGVRTLAGELPRMPDTAAATAWFDDEWQNLIELCRWAGRNGLSDLCWQLAFALRSYFFQKKHFDAWVDTQRWGLAAARAAGERNAELITLINLGTALFDRGDLDEASPCFSTALSLAEARNDHSAVTTLLANQGWISLYRGEFETTVQQLSRASTRYQVQNNLRNAAISERGIALALTALGDHDEAISIARHALNTFAELSLELDAAMAANCLGWAWYRADSLTEARAAYQEALTRAEQCGSSYEAARAYIGLGNTANAAGDEGEAQRCWSAADLRWPNLDPVMVGEAAARPAA